MMMTHLLELRRRLLICIGFFAVIFLALFFYADKLYHWFAIPLLKYLPDGSHMIATGVAAPFLAPLKLALIIALFVSIPVLLYHFWAFITPALYKHEKKLFLPLLIASIFLFYLGSLFAYSMVLPLFLQFMLRVLPVGVKLMPDISQYLDFTLKLLFAFGLAFQVPIVVCVLIKTGISNVSTLSKKRPYIIVAAFIIGMLLTPPDIISQIMLAIPIWLLYEIGLLFARFSFAKQSEDSTIET